MDCMNSNIKLELFRMLLRIRLVEEKIAEKYSEQKMRCPVHLSVGQEAVAVGICSQLNESDYLVSNHRAHAHYLAKGGNLNKMIAEIYGKRSGCCKGHGGSMHLIDLEKGILGTTPIVGGSMPIAVGAAFKIFLKNEDRITVLFFGEGSTEEGVWAECLNFASLKKLPILFVCENNFFSVYSPLNVRQSKDRDRVKIARAHGILSKKGNGNDLEEVYLLAKDTINQIRSGKGPVFLEFDTYRYLEHCGPNEDDNLNYRNAIDIDYWKKNCALKNYQKKISHQALLNNELLRQMKEQISSEISLAFQMAESEEMPLFNEEDEDVYAK